MNPFTILTSTLARTKSNVDVSSFVKAVRELPVDVVDTIATMTNGSQTMVLVGETHTGFGEEDQIQFEEAVSKLDGSVSVYIEQPAWDRIEQGDVWVEQGDVEQQPETLCNSSYSPVSIVCRIRKDAIGIDPRVAHLHFMIDIITKLIIDQPDNKCENALASATAAVDSNEAAADSNEAAARKAASVEASASDDETGLVSDDETQLQVTDLINQPGIAYNILTGVYWDMLTLYYNYVTTHVKYTISKLKKDRQISILNGELRIFAQQIQGMRDQIKKTKSKKDFQKLVEEEVWETFTRPLLQGTDIYFLSEVFSRGRQVNILFVGSSHVRRMRNDLTTSNTGWRIVPEDSFDF